MQIQNKKLNSGFEMPTFGLGTWNMGGGFDKNPINDERDIEAIKAAIQAGITHIDSAEMYAEGHAEELVAQAINGIVREELFLVSKVNPEHLKFNDLIHSAKETLKRMQTDYLDLYLIHKPNPNIAIEETMKAMNELKKQGLVKNIGVSDFTKERLQEAQLFSKAKIVANQLHYNLIFREPEKKRLVEYCQNNDVMLIAWRPVQKGSLTTVTNPLMEQICKKYNKTPSQIAINWLISQPNIVTLSKMSNNDHLQENLGALTFTMDTGDIELLRKNFPDQQDISDAIPLI